MSGQRAGRTNFWQSKGVAFGLIGFLLLSVSGCVSSGKYEMMIDERNLALEEKAALQAEKNKLAIEKDILSQEQVRLSSLVAETEQEKQAAAMKAAEAEAEVTRQQQVYDSLQTTFAKEQQASQVKIEMMKTGVKVNLANEILFPSGSADLNPQGFEVLQRAAAELKKSPYQTIVAGFTDNVAISGNLQEKYPSNWELAAARAASVVRLLEAEGVPSAQLLAISFGENNPVASNDTPEERSKNRRIEIVLRPVPVTTN
ncbi:MAG: OmpA family protein [Desulfuromonadales bacterium]|nr:OmpA family protein [Desulfuromonadales bacterium]